jgi:asparagine synthase (glutamine-hydrolysing)
MWFSEGVGRWHLRRIEVCGIFGVLGSPLEDSELRWAVSSALDRIAHRGPDGFGVEIERSVGLALGHRRLSIVDLSVAGSQPMTSADGRLTVVFNGEIYNHVQLRSELKSQGVGNWRGHSDTETLLAAIRVWGIEATLTRCVGMFALALWDRDSQELHLARDRLGEKPLYYAIIGQSFVFSSELAALIGWPGFTPSIDRDALAGYMRVGWYSGQKTALEGVWRLPPAHTITLALNALSSVEINNPRPYWKLIDCVRSGLANPLSLDLNIARDLLETQLRESVSGQMVADVPTGAFLSGGVDSSLVVALMQTQSSQRVRTFSIGFEDPAFDEGKYARSVANYLNTDHTELYVGAVDILDLVPRIGLLFSEPHADMSQIPTQLVSGIARHGVTVALSGDGGDELFAGYNRHLFAESLWLHSRKLPNRLRKVLGAATLGVGSLTWGGLSDVGTVLGLPMGRLDRIRDKGHKVARALMSEDVEHYYLSLIAQWHESNLIGIEAGAARDTVSSLPDLSLTEQLLVFDSLGYLPDGVLAKVDRCAMSVSLETRAPFLDHRVVELAWRLPLAMKVSNGKGKLILREVLRRYLPDALFERPKMGFSVPMANWLRGPLRDWAEDLLSVESLQAGGLLRVQPIRRKWAEHLSGTRNWEGALWTVLVFQAWRRQWKI